MHRQNHRTRSHNPLSQSLPYGVRIFAWVRAIRWIGWGLGEALIPVFILHFSKTFAVTGIFSSIVDIAALVSLPVIGFLADRVSAKRLVLWALLAYPLVGINYFLAGICGMAVFIVVARVINGVIMELENVGVSTYYRRVVKRKGIATAFGYIEAWSHVAWFGAALIGMALVLFMPIYFLLLGIAPFAIIAYFVALKAPDDGMNTDCVCKQVQVSAFINACGESFLRWRSWNVRLLLLVALVMFSSFSSALMYFFIPIDAYLSGANLQMVVLVTGFGTIPAIFAYKLGKIADKRNEYGLIVFGLAFVAVIALGLAIFPHYWFKLSSMFVLGIILEMFYVIQNKLITTLGPSDEFGKRGSCFEVVVIVGDLSAPVILGAGLDLFGFGNTFLIVASVALILGISYFILGLIKEGQESKLACEHVES